jgi:hypothetical protein
LRRGPRSGALFNMDGNDLASEQNRRSNADGSNG